jgi:hypothetical protein
VCRVSSVVEQRFCKAKVRGPNPRPGSMKTCLQCQKVLTTKRSIYCSNNCQLKFQFDKYITDWKQGIVSGTRGTNTYNISQHLKRYILSLRGEKCWNCGWDQKHPTTNVVPLEIDHIDGDPSNNKETNLRLLCPNCHSLTTNFRNLNKGRGRSWRLKP